MDVMEIFKNVGLFIVFMLASWKLYELIFPKKEKNNTERELNMSKMFIICLATYMYEQETGKKMKDIVPPQDYVDKASKKILEWGNKLKF